MHIFGHIPRRFIAFALHAAAVASLAAAMCLPVATDAVVGIDLGSSSSRVAVYNNGRIKIMADDQGQHAVPSYVALTEAGWLVGEDAKRQASTNPENTVYGVMRFLGRQFNDPSVQEHIRQLPFQAIDKDGSPIFRISSKGNEQDLTPEEAMALVLGKLKAMAINYLSRNVKKAVVAVPAQFDDSQRQALKAAGKLAGLMFPRMISEPIAAALAYRLDKAIGEKNILVYNFGASSFDVSVLNIDNGIFEVWATNNDAHLGGKNFDDRLTEYLYGMCEKKYGKDCTNDTRILTDLRREAEVAGRALLSGPVTRVELGSFVDDEDFSVTVTRTKLEELNMDLFERTLEIVGKTLRDAGLSKNQIDEIVLVGSSTRIPKVVQLLEDYFDGKKALSGIDPEEAIAYGAALKASFLLFDGVLEPCFIDTPTVRLSVGIETAGGVMAKFVSRNSSTPTIGTRFFTTATDNQSTVLIQVYEGERALTQHNQLLGTLELTNIPPAARGVPRIKVTLEHDTEATLYVIAVDLGTGKSQSMRVARSMMKDDEFEHIMKEAERFEEEDRLEKEAIAARVAFEFFPQPQDDVIGVDTYKGGNQAFRTSIVEVNVEEDIPEASDKQLISLSTIEESDNSASQRTGHEEL